MTDKLKKMVKMKRPLTITLAIFITSTLVVGGLWLYPGKALAVWYDANWTYREKVTIQSSQVDSTLTDFSVYLDMSDFSAGFWSNVKANCADVRITTSDGLTEVPREVVWCTTGSSIGEIHFKATSISSSVDTDFYIYYGNAAATEPAITATYGAENVWTKYSGVFHNEDANPGTAVLDSTASSTDMTDIGSMTADDSVTGKIGQGFDFDGTDDGLFAGVSTFDSYPYVMEAWVTTPASSSANEYISAISSSAGSDVKWVSLYVNGTGNILAATAITFANEASAVSSGIHYNETIHVVGVFTSATSREIYINGTSEGTNTTSKAAPFGTLNFNMGFSRSGLFGDVVFIDGIMDEVRYSENDSITGATGSLGGANFIDAQYTNQNTPNTFYVVASQEAVTTVAKQIKIKAETIKIKAGTIKIK